MVFRIHKYSYTFNGEAGLVNSRWFMASCSRRILWHKEHAKMSCAVQISKRLVDYGRSYGKPMSSRITFLDTYDDVIKWKHFPRNWPFVRGIHRSLVNSPHKVQWRGALMSKQSWGWGFETPSRSLWRHRNVSDGLSIFSSWDSPVPHAVYMYMLTKRPFGHLFQKELAHVFIPA